MEHARPPAELVLEGGPAARADAWRKWLQQFRVFIKASGVSKKTSDVQASLLLNLIGSDGYNIYSTFKFENEKDHENIDKVIEKYNHHFGTKPNTTMLRFKFFTRNQQQGESIDEYVTALKLLSQQCEFEQLEDGLLRDRIVCGVGDGTVRDRLLRSDDLTLDKAIRICQSNEISNDEGRQIEVVKGEREVSVDVIWNGRGGGSRGPGRRARRWRGGWRGARGLTPAAAANAATATICARRCAACGDADCDGAGGVRCAARNARCYTCGYTGHFRKMCNVRLSNKVFEVRGEQNDDDFLYVSTVDDADLHSRDTKWYETLYLCNSDIGHRFKLDTGSDINVISLKTLLRLGFSREDIIPDKINALSFCGNIVSIIGSCIIGWLYKNKKYIIKLAITEYDCQSILGKNTLEQIGLVTRVYSLCIDNYSDLFEGLGKLSGEYKIPIDTNIAPTICPVRKIPLGLRNQLQIELSRMEALGVIRKVTHPTPWVNAIVIAAKKNGAFRLCLDPRPLNKAIKRQHYPLPTLVEIATKLNGAQYYSKLNAKSGFWMVQLDKESSDLCTFGTPFGRYQFLRLPYGINAASEVFHAKVRQILEDLEGVDSFVDDVIVWGSTVQEHDDRLKKLLDRARLAGIKFNREKCVFRVQEVTYLGHKFNAHGMQIDENKLKAITEMPSPKNRHELERFLGMINYLCKFISNYSQKVTLLRNLLKKGVEWQWGPNEDNVVEKLKQELCQAPVLTLFRADQSVLISVDASSHSLGSVLLQGGRPVEFASITLTETQQRYAQIEKEMLAIVFALERFHQYIYGKHDILVETDHKPLESLFKKPLDSVPARLQRMMLRIQRYDFEVVYKPGKYMFISDTLSRAALPELLNNKICEEIQDQSCFLIQHIRFSDEKSKVIKACTKNDYECQLLIEYILKGWPVNKFQVDERIRRFWDYRESFEVINDIIFKDNLVFIPRDLRTEMLSRVHEGHLGIDRCKRRAREVMFWPGMSRDIENVVRRCATCQKFSVTPQRETMISHEIPALPWSKIGSDIFEYKKKHYLILIDYFSNFVEVCSLSAITSKCVIIAMKEQFARHGIPQQLITDNGPAYASKEFRLFTKTWGFSHVTSSPNYPQSNGKSERTVRTIKTMLMKTLDDGSDFHIALLNFRATPSDGVASPAQLLMGRRLNTRLPSSHDKLEPDRDNAKDYHNILKKREKSKLWYDSRARNLPNLDIGDTVITVDGSNRRKAQVVSHAEQPRSYFVNDRQGKCFRRNRRHLIKIPEPVLSPSTSCQEMLSAEDEAGSSDHSLYEDSYEVENEINKNPKPPMPSNNRMQRAAASEAIQKIRNLYNK